MLTAIDNDPKQQATKGSVLHKTTATEARLRIEKFNTDQEIITKVTGHLEKEPQYGLGELKVCS